MAKDMFKVDDAKYIFSTQFTEISGKNLINILLTVKSKKEVIKKAKNIYLQRGLCNKKIISEYIKLLIKKYQVKDKGNPE